ncbi:hypothetical protein F4827_004190 [Paraburkholderia bannensis]|uniref:Uncharacterized protein n=1 Tax=Paraburkholderia bannensis TaxID=765414 RepID=A0A7W9U130_9BURK|nr:MULTISPECIES: hypothetical protein [Paraburkholderia]MBB3259315.1 hypothetical protein [Paraburkholderia sp. WP4_3_2]MBB6104331.1 hypothetical protein [Paraburkholderia bannensis]
MPLIALMEFRGDVAESSYAVDDPTLVCHRIERDMLVHARRHGTALIESGGHGRPCRKKLISAL